MDTAQTIEVITSVPGYAILPLRSQTLPPATHTNCIIAGSRRALLVDPGSSDSAELRKLVNWLHTNQIETQSIFLTHHHQDHIAGAEILARTLSIPIIAHTRTIDHVKQAPDVHYKVNSCRRIAIDTNRVLDIIYTPGHAPGHLCLWEACTRTLVGGDMISSVSTTLIDPDEGDMSDYLESMSCLANLEPETIIPAHGPPIASGTAAINQVVDHRLLREQRVYNAVDHGLRSLEEIANLAYSNSPNASPSLARRSTLSHLRRLEALRRIRSSKDGWRLAE